jgi:hypothetical protein
VSIFAFDGLRVTTQPYSPLVAIGLALMLPPIVPIATKGTRYLRRTNDGIDLPMYEEHGNPSGTHPRVPPGVRGADMAARTFALVPEHGQGRRPGPAHLRLTPRRQFIPADSGNRADTKASAR